MKENIRNTGILEKIVEMNRLFKKIFFCFVYIKWLKLLRKHGGKMV